MTETQIVVFCLNDGMCGSDLYAIEEIVQYQEITPVPNMPECMSGLINLRNRVVPVIDLNKKFNLGETQITEEAKIIVASFDQKSLGFLVNKVLEILKLTEEDIEKAPDAALNEKNKFLLSIAKKGSSLISILDFKGILESHELKKIEAIEV